METTELISTLQTYLNERITAPVQVTGTDERPVPVVLINSWSTTQSTQHNTNYIHSEYDEYGIESARVYRVPYDCRVSFEIRHDDTVEASRLHDSLRFELSKLESNPSQLSGSVSMVTVGNGGGINHQFIDPTEAEITQSATFLSAFTYVDESLTNIEEVDFDVVVTNKL